MYPILTHPYFLVDTYLLDNPTVLTNLINYQVDAQYMPYLYDISLTHNAVYLPIKTRDGVPLLVTLPAHILSGRLVEVKFSLKYEGQVGIFGKVESITMLSELETM